MIHGEVAKIYSDEGAVALYHDEVPGLMGATRAPASMEFVVENRDALKKLKVGQNVTAAVRRQGRDFVLSDLNVVHFLLR